MTDINVSFLQSLDQSSPKSVEAGTTAAENLVVDKEGAARIARKGRRSRHSCRSNIESGEVCNRRSAVEVQGSASGAHFGCLASQNFMLSDAETENSRSRRSTCSLQSSEPTTLDRFHAKKVVIKTS